MGLEDTIKGLNKVFDREVVTKLVGKTSLKDPISTGSYTLDYILGGGIPKGRLVEVFGPPSSGKSTLALHMIKEAQKFGKVLFVDAENSFDSLYAAAVGVDIENLLICQPDYSEQAFTVIEKLVQSGELSLVVLDSVASLSPKAEFQGESGDANMGLSGRLNGQHIRKVSILAAKNNTILFYINQIRHNLGITYGSNIVTPGGNALKFHASARLEIKRIETLKDGIKSKVRVVKSKFSVPYKVAQFSIIFGKGIDNNEELITLGVEKGLVKQKGAWYYFKDIQLGQGINQAKENIQEYKDAILTD